MGPLSLSALGVYFAWNLIDGLTYVLRRGEDQWSTICEHPVVAAALRSWQQQQQQQQEEAEALAAKAEMAAEAHAAAAFAEAAAAAVPGKKWRAATEKAAALAVAGAAAAAAATRAPFALVDSALKYCGPDGQWMVFDTVDKIWRPKHVRSPNIHTDACMHAAAEAAVLGAAAAARVAAAASLG